MERIPAMEAARQLEVLLKRVERGESFELERGGRRLVQAEHSCQLGANLAHLELSGAQLSFQTAQPIQVNSYMLHGTTYPPTPR